MEPWSVLDQSTKMGVPLVRQCASVHEARALEQQLIREHDSTNHKLSIGYNTLSGHPAYDAHSGPSRRRAASTVREINRWQEAVGHHSYAAAALQEEYEDTALLAY